MKKFVSDEPCLVCNQIGNILAYCRERNYIDARNRHDLQIQRQGSGPLILVLHVTLVDKSKLSKGELKDLRRYLYSAVWHQDLFIPMLSEQYFSFSDQEALFTIHKFEISNAREYKSEEEPQTSWWIKAIIAVWFACYLLFSFLFSRKDSLVFRCPKCGMSKRKFVRSWIWQRGFWHFPPTQFCDNQILGLAHVPFAVICNTPMEYVSTLEQLRKHQKHQR